MKLSDTQHLYVQTIYDYFHLHGKWPTYGYIDRALNQIRRDLDIEKIAKSLPMGYATAFAFNHDLKADAVLSISAISVCDGSEEDLADFIKALNFCVEKYFNADGETVKVSSDELAQQLHMTAITVHKIGFLIKDAYEYPVYSVFGATDTHYNEWNCTLSRSIRRFNGVTSVTKYLEKIDPAHAFQMFVRDLLKDSGYKDIIEPEDWDSGYDFRAIYPVTSPQSTTNEQNLLVQIKYRNLGGQLSVDMLRRFVAQSQAHGADKALFVTNTTATSKTKEFALGNEVEIWDAHKLLSLLERFPELKQHYSEVVAEQLDVTMSANDSIIINTHDQYNEIIQELRGLPTGNGKAYEDTIKKVLEICFKEDFSPFRLKEQVKTDNGKRIRDFTIDNRSPKLEFWLSLKRDRRVEKVLFDAKNYKNPITYSEISSTIRYLDFNKAFGNFLIIISRNGVKDTKEFIEVFSKKERVILCLNDQDLITMINLSKQGESATRLIEDKYYDLLDTQ